MINVFIGYDPREAVAFSVLSYSLRARFSDPVSISTLMLSQLKGLMTRERHLLYNRESCALAGTERAAWEKLMLYPIRIKGLLSSE